MCALHHLRRGRLYTEGLRCSPLPFVPVWYQGLVNGSHLDVMQQHTHTHTQSSQLYFIYNRKYFLAVHLAIVSPSPFLFFSTTSVAISLSPFYPISDFTASLSALRRKTLRQKETEDTQQLHYSSIQRTKNKNNLLLMWAARLWETLLSKAGSILSPFSNTVTLLHKLQLCDSYSKFHDGYGTLTFSY